MPKMTGVELAAEITALRPGVPIILCTGLAGKITEEEAGQSGIQAMIKKPVSKNDLAKTVRTVLDRKD
jgi:two-component system cell cycle sensor histidine kinase/response regulator CckA